MDEADELFLKQHGVIVLKYNKFQIGLRHPEIASRFVWFPTTGALMRYKPKPARWEGADRIEGTYLTVKEAMEKMMEYR